MGQLLGAAQEPEADNSTADLDHLEPSLGGGQQQALLVAIRAAMPTNPWPSPLSSQSGAASWGSSWASVLAF